jgi:hypothetical protein
VSDLPPAPAAQADLPESDEAVRPHLGVMVLARDDGHFEVHGIEPDGTEHSIIMPAAHGALVAFQAAMQEWFTKLGQRAAKWTKTPPGADHGEE